MLKLTLRNWCSHANTTLTFQDLTFVVGRNGSGKSSGVPEALEFVWLGTGKLRGAPTKKVLADWSIRDDFADCEVIAETCGLRIRRTMDREGSQEVYRSKWVTDGGGRWTEEEPAPLARDQGNPFGNAPDDLVRCMLEPTYFLEKLDPQRRQEILVMATSDQNVSYEVALEALMKKLEPESDDDRKAVEDAAHWITDEGFRGAEEAAVEQRKTAKRERKDVVVGDLPEPLFLISDGDEDGAIDLAEYPAEEHEAQLAHFRTDHTQAVRIEASGAGALGGKLAEAESALVALEATPLPPLDALDRRVAEKLKAWQECLAAPDPTPPDQDQREMCREQLETAQQELADARAVIDTGITSVKALEAEDQQAPSDFPRPKTCPNGPSGMRCPVKPSVWNPEVSKTLGDVGAKTAELDRMRGELTQAKERLQEAVTGADSAAAAAVAASAPWDAFADARQAKSAADEERATARRASEDADAALDAALKHRAAERDDAVAQAKARVDTARQALEDTQEGDQPSGPSVADLETSIGLGERVVEASRSYWRERADHEGRRQAAEELDATVVRWDAICQELKPDGIETTLGGGALESFLDLLRDTRALTGEISMDEDCQLSVTVDREGFPKHPLQLSTSQQMAVGCALQHALCRQLDFPLLVVDALDRFDAEHLDAWATIAGDVAPHYAGGVIGLATIKSEPPSAPRQPWQTIWLKSDGSAELLEEF